MRSRADLAVVKDETVSLSFFKEVVGRGYLLKQQEIYCYHKRKSKEVVCMQSVLQESIKILHLPLLLLRLTLPDAQNEITASFRAFISFGSKD